MGESDNIEGIDDNTENKLVSVGIITLEDLRSMNIQEVHEVTGISTNRLKSWQVMAVLQLIEDVDKQLTEALVKMGIYDFRGLMETDPNEIVVKLNYYQ